MAFLLAKIAALLLTATLLGAWLQRWWTRRHYQDVTTEYQQLSADWRTWRQEVNAKLQPPEPTDLTPVLAAIAAIRIPEPQALDLAPLQERLDRLERMLSSLHPATPPATDGAQPLVRAGSRNLLTHAAYGPPDDLKRIRGVAEVLERMLHTIGVYYFWQIADWTPDDIAHADAQLTAFKGRISRDDWVTQARQFAQTSNAAPPPLALAS